MNRLRLGWQLVRLMGARWVLFRAAYAARQRAGWDAWRLPGQPWEAVPLAGVVHRGTPVDAKEYSAFRRDSGGRFFVPGRPAPGGEPFASWDNDRATVVQDAARIAAGEFLYFEHEWIRMGRPPDWHVDPFTGQHVPSVGHWSRLDEFGSGDIKLVWELNRFGFVFPLVRAYWRTGDESLAECFWQLVEDWCAHNPPQTGMNWKCGQESTFRAMAWCFGLYGFAASAAQTPERVALMTRIMAVTGSRVAWNLRYALSQKNNHGISEPAGLWTIGNLFPELREAARWKETGRTALESQVRELVYDDGGFSQHSVNYHRVMLEDCLWCLQIGRANGGEFSPDFVGRVSRAGNWIHSLLDEETGRVPNLGSNDGAHVLPLSNCGYPDYRPVVQAAAIVTAGQAALRRGVWDELAWWLGCLHDETPAAAAGPSAAAREDFSDSGLTVLRAGATRAVVRTPRRFRHRPAQCDLLHVDLWNGATNVLRDSGTYRYSSDDNLGAYFKSAAAHNTVQFDGRDQMPALSRFLLGEWPDGELRAPENQPSSLIASYTDWRGCRHERTVSVSPGRCVVSDRVTGFEREAVLRWHLCSEASWVLDGSTCRSHLATIDVRAATISSIRLIEGRESLFYNAISPLSVLEIAIPPSVADLQTEIVLAKP